jgi:hypothetical protein
LATSCNLIQLLGNKRMNGNELTESDFRETIVQPVTKLIAEDDKPDVDVNDYLKACNRRHKLLVTRSDFVPLSVLASADARHVHLVYSYGEEDRVLVVVVDAQRKAIRGHFLLKVKDDGPQTGLLAFVNGPRQGGAPQYGAEAKYIESK